MLYYYVDEFAKKRFMIFPSHIECNIYICNMYISSSMNNFKVLCNTHVMTTFKRLNLYIDIRDLSITLFFFQINCGLSKIVNNCISI